MKRFFFILLWAAAPGFAQSPQGETKISQRLLPDCSIGSTTVVTKVFAREGDEKAWLKIYESEVAVTKTRHTKAVKASEREKAEAAGRLWISRKAMPEPMDDTRTVPVRVRELSLER